MNENVLRTLARTIWGEARGEYALAGEKALIAVGCVVMNRLNHPTRFEESLEAVCRAAYQFSCWNPTDPNYSLLQQKIIRCGVYCLCESLARQMMCGNVLDITKGANHYHSMLINPPYWADPAYYTCRIGHHKFYKLI